MAWFVAYFAVLLASALFHNAKNSGTHYFVYGRKASTGLVCCSLLASCIGGSATIGMMGLAWQAGFPAFWWLGAGAAGLLVLALCLAGKIRKSHAWTMPQIIENTLGSTFRKIAATIIFLTYLPIMAAQFGALQTVIASLTGLDPSWAMAAGVLTVLFYTAIGGQGAVIRSDLWQFGIMVAMLTALLGFCLYMPQGRAELAAMPLQFLNDDFPPERLLYFLFILGGSFIVGPMLFGRLLSARNTTCARNGALYAAFSLFIIAIIITCIGVAMRGFPMPADIAPQECFGYFAQTFLPPWTRMPVLLGMYSIILSSADSCLFTTATVCANDLLQKPSIKNCRLFMLLVCALAYGLAMQGRGILALLLMANDIYVCGLVVPIFITMLGERRFTIQRPLMLCAVLAGGGTGFCAAMTNAQWLSFTAFGMATLFSLLSLRKRK